MSVTKTSSEYLDDIGIHFPIISGNVLKASGPHT